MHFPVFKEVEYAGYHRTGLALSREICILGMLLDFLALYQHGFIHHPYA